MELIDLARSLVHLVSDVLMISDESGEIWFAGPSVEQKLGWRIDEVIGHRVWEVLVAEWASPGESCDVKALFDRAVRTSEEEAPHDWIVLRGRDGCRVAGWLTVIPLGRPLSNALVVFRLLERDGEESRMWRKLFDLVGDPLVVLDWRFRIRELNAAARRLAASPEADVRGLPCWRVFHGVDGVPHTCPLPGTLRTGKTMCATVEDAAGGKWEVVCQPILDSDDRATFVLERIRAVSPVELEGAGDGKND